jgi:hypothetical protein
MNAQLHHSTCQVSDPDEKRETEMAVRRVLKEIAGVNFLPWIGSNYGKQTFLAGKRILILGHSHYEWCKFCWDNHIQREKDFTCRCIAELVVGKREGERHWRIIEYALTENSRNKDSRQVFWNGVAYYNYVQEMVGLFEGGRPPIPTLKMWADAKVAFPNIISALSPDYIVVLGYTLWDFLPSDGRGLDPVEEQGKVLLKWEYRYGDSCTIALRCRHPAAGFGATWYPALRKAIEGK